MTPQPDTMNLPPPPAQPASFGLLTRLALLLCVVAGCLAILEIGLRTTGRYRMGSVDGFLAAGGPSYRLKPNASKTVAWPSTSFSVHTSIQGFRTARPGPLLIGDEPYFAVLGSSEVFGNGLDYEDTFIGVLARKLAGHDIELINMAVPGHHLLEQISQFEEFAASTNRPPKWVMIILNPLFIGGYDDIHAGTIVRRGELFDEDRWRMALARMILANSSAAYCFFRDNIRGLQQKYFSREDFALSFYVERYSTAHRIRKPEVAEDFRNHLRGLEQRIHQLGATPIYVYGPTVGGFLLNQLKAEGKLDGSLFDTEFFAELARRHAKEAGIQFIDLEPLLQAEYDQGKTLNFAGDAHFNGPTSLLIGEYLYQELKPEGNPSGQ